MLVMHSPDTPIIPFSFMKRTGRKSAEKASPRKKSSASTRRKSRVRMPAVNISLDTWIDGAAMLLLLVSAVTFFTAISGSHSAWSQTWLNTVGNVFGWAIYIAPLVSGAFAVYLLVRRFGDRLPLPRPTRVAGVLLGFVVALPSLHAIGGWIGPHSGAALAEMRAGGGGAGWGLLQFLQRIFGNVGTTLALTLLWVGALLLLSDMTLVSLWIQLRDGAVTLRNNLGAAITGSLEELRRAQPADDRQPATTIRQPITDDRHPTVTNRQPATTIRQPIADDRQRTADDERPTAPVFKINTPTTTRTTGELNRVPPPRILGAENNKPTEPPIAQAPPAAPPPVQREWHLPSIEEMLDPGSDSTLQESDIRERAALIEETLLSFGVPGRVTEVNRGPTITQFGVEPGFIEMKGGKTMKVKVSRIASLADDLALALAAPRIRIEAPVPGRAIVGIEVPNGETALVSLRDVIESEVFAKLERKSKLALAFGQDVSGHPVVADLAAMPHLLIAGTTGSGKSVCVNGIIIGLLCNNTPDEVRFLMIDPKRVELTGYNGVPHLISPVIVDVEKAPAVLKWTLREMDSRYKTFAKSGVRNIVDYNAKCVIDNGQNPELKKLPYIVLVVDELADLMMMSPDETEKSIIRLAQMARATGIHLILATQRPSVDVVTGLIKANFPARIAFTVATAIDSRVILDSTGAEKLLGRGDMLMTTPESSAPMRAQGCYLSPKEIERVVRHWRAQLGGAASAPAEAAPDPLVTVDDGAQFTLPIVTPPAEESATRDGFNSPPTWDEAREMQAEAAAENKDDKLFNDAVNTVRLQGKASISLLQRRMRIGYTRAARLIEEMEERGIVGPTVPGQQHRDVL